MNLNQIREKYLGDSFGVEFKIDLNAMRESALSSLRDAVNTCRTRKTIREPNPSIRNTKNAGFVLRWAKSRNNAAPSSRCARKSTPSPQSSTRRKKS